MKSNGTASYALKGVVFGALVSHPIDSNNLLKNDRQNDQLLAYPYSLFAIQVNMTRPIAVDLFAGTVGPESWV